MLNIYNQDDPRMSDYDVKKAIIIIDIERKRVLEYIYMIHKDTKKEYVKHSSMYSKSAMINAIETATFEEYENDYVDVVVDAIVNNCKVNDNKEIVIQLATAIKNKTGRFGHSLAQDENGKILLTALVENNM